MSINYVTHVETVFEITKTADFRNFNSRLFEYFSKIKKVDAKTTRSHTAGYPQIKFYVNSGRHPGKRSFHKAKAPPDVTDVMISDAFLEVILSPICYRGVDEFNVDPNFEDIRYLQHKVFHNPDGAYYHHDITVQLFQRVIHEMYHAQLEIIDTAVAVIRKSIDDAFQDKLVADKVRDRQNETRIKKFLKLTLELLENGVDPETLQTCVEECVVHGVMEK